MGGEREGGSCLAESWGENWELNIQYWETFKYWASLLPNSDNKSIVQMMQMWISKEQLKDYSWQVSL